MWDDCAWSLIRVNCCMLRFEVFFAVDQCLRSPRRFFRWGCMAWCVWASFFIWYWNCDSFPIVLLHFTICFFFFSLSQQSSHSIVSGLHFLPRSYPSFLFGKTFVLKGNCSRCTAARGDKWPWADVHASKRRPQKKKNQKKNHTKQKTKTKKTGFGGSRGPRIAKISNLFQQRTWGVLFLGYCCYFGLPSHFCSPQIFSKGEKKQRACEGCCFFKQKKKTFSRFCWKFFLQLRRAGRSS